MSAKLQLRPALNSSQPPNPASRAVPARAGGRASRRRCGFPSAESDVNSLRAAQLGARVFLTAEPPYKKNWCANEPPAPISSC
jgi:hypothetical protein